MKKHYKVMHGNPKYWIWKKCIKYGKKNSMRSMKVVSKYYFNISIEMKTIKMSRPFSDMPCHPNVQRGLTESFKFFWENDKQTCQTGCCFILFRNKRFMLDEMAKRNVSKVTFSEYKIKSFSSFFSIWFSP